MLYFFKKRILQPLKMCEMEQGVGTERNWSLGLSNSCGVGILFRDPDIFKHCTFRCDAAGLIIYLDCTFNSQDLRFINIYALTDGTISHRNNRYRMRTPIFSQ
jgi:hypothetical protein